MRGAARRPPRLPLRLLQAQAVAGSPHCPPAAHPAAFVPSVDFITAVLQGLGVRHTVVAIDAAAALPLDMHALLTAPDGSARYAGWVM